MRKISDKDRLLSFAFTATTEQLEDAISVFKAALRAKQGVGAPRKRTAKPIVAPSNTKAQTTEDN